MRNKIDRKSSDRLKSSSGLNEYDSSDFLSFSSNEEKNLREEKLDIAESIGPYVKRFADSLKSVFREKIAPSMSSFVVKVGVLRWALLLIATCVGLLGFVLLSGGDKDSALRDVQGVVVENEGEKPAFETLETPDGSETKYDSSKKVASFQDVVAGKNVIVSQQEVPEDKKSNEFFLLEVATAFNINKEFQSEKGGVFIGENQEAQVQTAIFRHKDLLIFLQVQSIVPNASILKYINSL